MKLRYLFAALLLTLTLCLSASGFAAGYSSLSYGDSGVDVSSMQRALKNKGYYGGAVDGIFSVDTLVSVCAFQSAKGLTVDGIAGNLTLGKLYAASTSSTAARSSSSSAASASSSALRYGQTSARVTALQQALSDAGYYGGRIDGYYGSVTKRAVTCYQRDHGLYVDGIAGEETLTSLYGCAFSAVPIDEFAPPPYDEWTNVRSDWVGPPSDCLPVPNGFDASDGLPAAPMEDSDFPMWENAR